MSAATSPPMATAATIPSRLHHAERASTPAANSMAAPRARSGMARAALRRASPAVEPVAKDFSSDPRGAAGWS